MNLNGKTAIITGSSRGLGKAIALKFAQSGANIVLNASNNSIDIEQTFEEFKNMGFNVVVSQGDISDSGYSEILINKAIETFNSLDILVNNAGITRDKLLIKMTEEDWDSVMNVNLKSTFLCTKAALKYMSKKKYGRIINISSIVGLIGNAGQSNYSASKAGLIGFTKTIAKEFSSRKITCNCIAPGFILSKMTDVLSEKVKESFLAAIPLKRFGLPEEVASLANFLSSDEASYITGQVINIDGGLVM